MSIDLRKFVDINIQRHEKTAISGIRDTVALFTKYGTKGTTNEIASLADAQTKYASDTATLAYLTVFFNNGGAKVKVYEGYTSLTLADIKALPNEQICVAAVGQTETAMRTLAVNMNSDSTIYGINEKIILARITTKTTDSTKVKNYAVKYSNTNGAEMTIAAYLSKIDTHAVDTVFDYAFTQEALVAEDNITDNDFDTLIANNYNFDIVLANQVRICGGNCKDGAELTNNYVRIVLHQTLTDSLVQVLMQKISSNRGLGKIYAAITTEMNYYLRDGYLTTDKIWDDDSWKVTDKNGQTYTIVEKGTPLVNGYIAKMLPLSSLTEDDKNEHRAPRIYIAIADQYAIRKIELDGEII